MRAAASIVLAASTVLAQEIGFSGGPNIVSGSNAISNPTINNGWLSDSSLIVGRRSVDTGNVFNDVVGSTFTNINANAAIKDNLINNPGATSVSGNSGWTANGDANAMGPVANQFGRRGGDVVFADNHHQVSSQVAAQVQPVAGVVRPVAVAGGFVPFFKRGGDVVFADNHHQVNSQAAAAVVPQAQFVQPEFVHAAPVFHPGVVPFFKRSGDVVFADNHHQVNSHVAAEFVPQAHAVALPVAFEAPRVVEPVAVPFVHPVVAPLVAEQGTQSAAIVQNQV
ncbi:hypothetical protein H4R18_001052 [Coemansia javaensis]|uniref:Uncharacterized protein n=1 Tax=Coemansia javaensis TaxID=2761396 RepID=A0A9W8HKX3_9FUNG|nr:hypothetical protein H4R18_001052 [Coemansia javaensis]